MRSISFIILILLLFSCSKKNNTATFSNFPISKRVYYKTVNTPPILTYIEYLSSNSTHLVFVNCKRDKIFQVFSLPDLSFLGEYGTKGGGPKDFNLPMKFGQFDDNFYLIDNNSLKVFYFNDTLNMIYEKKLPGKLIALNEFVMQNDSLYFGTSSNESIKKELFRYSYKDNNLEDFSDYPPDESIQFNPRLKFELYFKRLSINRNLKKLAILYSKQPILKIYNTKSLKVEKELMYECGIKQTSGIRENSIETDNMYIFYKDIYTSEKFIYGLYIGKTPTQIESDYSNMKTFLHVWNWNGSPVAEYDLGIPIFKFIIYDDSKLIGVVPDDEKRIYTFELEHKKQ